MKLKALAVFVALFGVAAAAHADTVSVTTSTAAVVSGTSSRKHLYLYNAGPGIVYVGTTGAKATSAEGYVLKSSDTLTMQDFSGSLYGSASATSDLRVLKQTR